MKKIHFLLFVSLAVSLLSGNSALALDEVNSQSIPLNIKFETVVTGLSAPVFVTHAGDGSNRLFIVEKGGRILIYKNGSLNPDPFLDISSEVITEGEQGLLGLAFAPDYSTSGYFYIYYNNPAGDIEVARYTVSGDADIADDTSKLLVIQIDKVSGRTNHNGGMLAFGPDTYLYMFVGDGGSGGDPDDNGQNKDSLLGKILRLDVTGDDFPADANKNYAIPSLNPFAGATSGADEIWAYGLRNPWRASFDSATGDLYIGDVGQGWIEEVDFQPSSSTGGENYGWDDMEGSQCFEPSNGCDTSGKVPPVTEYTHENEHCSVTGGYVYRGSMFTDLQGVYLYADFCAGTLYGLQNTGSTWYSKIIRDTDYNIASFGEGEDGELYVVNLGGSILKIVESPILTKTAFSQKKYDGFVSEYSENSNIGGSKNYTSGILQIGDRSSDSQIIGLLSFATNTLPDDAIILSAQVQLHKAKIAGQPFSQLGTLKLDIQKGGIGTSPSLQLNDFNSKVSMNNAALLGNSNPLDGWYVFNLKGGALSFIHKQGVTQFKVRFAKPDNDDHAADWVKVHSGNYANPLLRPFITITYYIP